MNEVAKCRRDHNRLGFAYQIGFARLFNRFPAQQPLEINDELLSFVAVRMNIDSERISDYASWQHTVSEHQARIQHILGCGPLTWMRATPWSASLSRSPAVWSRPPCCLLVPRNFSKNGGWPFPLSPRYCVYWQAKEISRVLKMGIPEGERINISLLEHVSPIERENVILYGQYVLNPEDIR